MNQDAPLPLPNRRQVELRTRFGLEIDRCLREGYTSAEILMALRYVIAVEYGLENPDA